MSERKRRSPSGIASVCWGLLFALVPVAGADPVSTLEALEAYDQQFFSGYTVKIQGRGPAVAHQGTSVSEITITGDGETQALRMEAKEFGGAMKDAARMDPSQLRTTGAPFNVNTGSLGVKKGIYILLQGKMQKARFDSGEVGVSESGVLSTAVPATSDTIITIGSGGLQPFYEKLLALGRGYAQLIDSIVSEEKGEDGILRVEATGNFFNPEVPGIWSLEIDPENDYLVRKARFGLETGSTFEISCASEGVKDGDVAIAAKGSFTGVATTEYTVQEYSNAPAGAAIGAVQKAVNNMEPFRQPGARLIDYNLMSGDGVPLLSRTP